MRCTTQAFNGHMQSEDEILDGGIAQAPIIFTMDGVLLFYFGAVSPGVMLIAWWERSRKMQKPTF
ncbi:hypothetical protein ACF8FG_16455 [Pseudomonas sp. YQ_6]|uniref:hypothetical protein n=1 Tax=Pseudomonas TaxID=286 RepID=UPI0009537295|nr:MULTISPECIES: hypothetical protein [Pseudomonas]MDW2777543.1 hypothetical protein [Pseudomonas sp. BEA3.1]SIR90675.1 hypothetical protein SAMN05216501_2628 [Pseudomonas putida]